MDVDSGPDGGLAKLKQLAGDLLVVEVPDLGVLDQIATLAAEVAAQRREATRQELLERVARDAQAILPVAGRALRVRLGEFPADELTAVAALLQAATGAREAFTQADTDLRAAHGRGDYAAMAPLALEADRRKTALADAIAAVEQRLGPGDAPLPESAAAAEEAAAAPAADDAPPESPDGVPGDGQGESPVERPRLRALIRQMRSVPDVAATRR
jgi:hypothetical protein